MIEKIIKFLKNHTIDLSLAFGSVALTSIFHWVGIFDFLELKTYDYRFHTVRGPLTGGVQVILLLLSGVQMLFLLKSMMNLGEY